MLHGTAYLHEDAYCSFGPFRPPHCASQEAVKLMCKCDNNKHELWFTFIGNGYLKLKVSREMVNMDPEFPLPPTAPEVFEFVGILLDPEEAERLEMERWARARREPSPRDTLFEMSHPTSWWNESTWW